MSLTEQARKDIQRITSDLQAFGVTMTFTSPDADTASVVGLHTKHHLGIDDETGAPINAKTASVSVAEKLLTDLSYPVRNQNGEVSLDGHLVKVKDSTGSEKTYLCSEWFPDEKVGLIVVILQDYAD